MQKTYKQTIITERLKALKGNKTLRAFVDQVDIGQSTLHNYLRGRPMPDHVIKKICVKTGCGPAYLLGLPTTKDDGDIGLKLAEAARLQYVKEHILGVDNE